MKEGRVNKIENNSSKSSRKTLKSPQSRPYEDLYKGRGKPPYEPEWVKDNGMERSPFGASWANDEKDRLPFPPKYPLDYKILKILTITGNWSKKYVKVIEWYIFELTFPQEFV